MADKEIFSAFMEFEDSLSLTQAVTTRSYEIHILIRSILVSLMSINSSIKFILAVLTGTKESSPLAQWEFRPTAPHHLKWPINGSTMISSAYCQSWRELVSRTVSSGSHSRRIARMTRWHFLLSIELIYLRRHSSFGSYLLKRLQLCW